MKTLKNYFLLVALALIAVFATGCGPKEEPLPGFIQLDNPLTFYNTYKSRNVSGKAILVDVRSAEVYAIGHLAEAINLPAMKADGKVNVKDLDPEIGGTWPKRLLDLAGDKNVAVFLYGNTNFTYTRDIAGHAAQVFGKENTYINLSSIEELQEAAMGNK